MTQPEPLWLFFGETAQVSLHRMSDGVTVYFEVIATSEAGSVLVMGGNAHIGSCELSVTPDGLCFLGLGLCTVPIANDGVTAQLVALLGCCAWTVGWPEKAASMAAFVLKPSDAAIASDICDDETPLTFRSARCLR